MVNNRRRQPRVFSLRSQPFPNGGLSVVKSSPVHEKIVPSQCVLDEEKCQVFHVVVEVFFDELAGDGHGLITQATVCGLEDLSAYSRAYDLFNRRTNP